MKINLNSIQHLKWHNRIFVLLLLSLFGLLAFLSTRYISISDWTVNGQNSLNEVSIKLLENLTDPVEIVSYTNKKSVQQAIQELISRYQRVKKDISLIFVDPNLDPDKVRNLQLSIDGEMIIFHQGRQEHLKELSEQMLSNSLHRLLRARKRQIVFVQGHGERSPDKKANFDLSDFSRHLKRQGMKIQTLNLIKSLEIAENTAVLIIAGPQANFLSTEVKLIIEYVKNGGNLLWLGDPLKRDKDDPMQGLLPLAEHLGIEFLDGVIVDPSTLDYDIKSPDYAIVTDYPPHAITTGFSTLTLFPQATGIERLPAYLEEEKKVEDEQQEENMFTMTTLLDTVERSWVETSMLKSSVKFDEKQDIAGPITLAMLLTREFNHEPVGSTAAPVKKQQRIIIFGDGDFLSNTYLGNGGNLTLGLNVFNWLSHDEQFLSIPIQKKNDIILDISPAKLSLLGGFFLFIVPALLITIGSFIWLKRRHR
ncbi:MAG: GldG family protein [Thiotrichaceae bacterium]|nr:GldG family protein [Thiotrichaceae bacterium]